MRTPRRGPLLGLLLGALSAGCASVGAWQEATTRARTGDHAGAASEYEDLARTSEGRTAAEAWYQAGLAWVDPANRRRNFGRGLACFRRVEAGAASRETARGTRAWISILEGLVSAREAASEADALRRAMEDVRSGSEALRRR